MTPLEPNAEAERLAARARLVKEQAKDLRDEGDIEGAIAILQRVVDEISTAACAPRAQASEEAGPQECQLGAELADCLGMLGGNRRRLGALEDAQRDFERGRALEESARLRIASSYNLVNAITLPLESTPATTRDLAQPLKDAIDAITRQVEKDRRRDRWAWADLAQCRLLLGDESGALQNFRQAHTLGDDATIASSVAVLERLERALRDKDPEAAARLANAARNLKHPGSSLAT